MYGVVIWSDRDADRAVIWCEDHGDLAFYRGDGTATAEMDVIEAGDLVQFDIAQGPEMRLARRPRLVVQDSHPGLARDLKRACGEMASLPDTRSDMPEPSDAPLASVNVVPFQLRRCGEPA